MDIKLRQYTKPQLLGLGWGFWVYFPLLTQESNKKYFSFCNPWNTWNTMSQTWNTVTKKTLTYISNLILCSFQVILKLKKKGERKEERTLSRFQFSWISSLELDYKEMKVKLLKIKSPRVYFSHLAIRWEIVDFTTELRHAQIAKEY